MKKQTKRRWFIYYKGKRYEQYPFASEWKARAFIRRYDGKQNENRFEYRKGEVQ